MLWMLLTAALAAEEARPPREAAWSARHPVALGVRGLVWGGEYVAPGFGGHLRLRPWRRLGVELFADHAHRLAGEARVHDNIIGFHAFVPLLGARRIYLAPTLGACVDFRLIHPTGGGPDASLVRFAPHAGAQLEAYVAGGLAVEVAGTVYAYIGNDADVAGWQASTSSRLSVTPTVQATVAVNYAF